MSFLKNMQFSRPVVLSGLAATIPYIYARFFGSNSFKFETFDNIFIPSISFATGALVGGMIENMPPSALQILPDFKNIDWENVFKMSGISIIMVGIITLLVYVCDRYKIEF